MKKFFAVLAMLLVCVTGAYASPFIATAPSESNISMVEIEVTKDGSVALYPGTFTVSGADILIFDLAPLTGNGSYTFRARWADAVGWWSDWSDPFTAIRVGRPGTFKIKR